MAATLDIATVAQDIADCVCQALADGGEFAGTCCVYPGSQVAWDSCCESKGQAWVVALSGYTTIEFPAPDLSPTRCADGHSLAMRFEIGVIRCICADRCSCETKTLDANRIFNDFETVMTGLQCCFDKDDDCGRDWVLSQFEFTGPDGGCAGCLVEIIVNMPLPCCPEGEVP